MGLLELPNELFIFIAHYLEYANLNSLCRVSRQLHNILNCCLYQRNIQQHGSDVLQWAAIHDSMATLKKALEYGANVDTTARIRTVLPFPDQFFSRCNQVLVSPAGRFVQKHFTGGASPVTELATPLMIAAGAGYTELVETLLQHGADVNARSKSGLTPLMAAASAGHTEAMEVLLAAGADTTPERGSDGTALHLAAHEGHADAVRLLLRADEDQRRIPWDEALVDATVSGHIHVVRAFLDAGADPRAKYHRHYAMPLIFWAASEDHPDIVSLLLEFGEDIECPNDTETLLIFAARRRSLKVCEILLRRGADVDARDERGRSAVWWAKDGGETEIEELLLRYGADTANPDEYLASEWEWPDSEMY